MALYAALARGMAVFSAGRALRTHDVVHRSERDLRDLGAEIVATYGSTGNLLIESRGAGLPLQHALELASGFPWAIVRERELRDALHVLDGWRTPRAPGDMRLTAGVAVALVPGQRRAIVDDAEPPLAYYRWQSRRIVLVRKLDCTDGPRLDSKHRRGGWGAISGRIAQSAGGLWTARSQRPLIGLLARGASRRG